ncbi:gamma-glutamyltranspeptidase [Microbacterium esteraromaticum]|uniref:Gamma-glutamyltranspeptidase n=1 Tax=Microbacterium esteraromaticum TaxID=57043 RepID=A0A7D8AHA1_9MICO|nr:gamma-glutamyltransferase [Microbacterium esteraromaticum]QMU96005.1 gamma-glutamyltranspeptidase [Microbacterium esteraromaticum]
MNHRTASFGAISTPHHTATQVGERILREGGNAIDAAVAAALALCVTYPNNVALGSDLVALVHAPDGSVIEVNATGPAPQGATVDLMRERHGDALPMYGVDTITVPGAVRGLERLLALGGAKTWREVVEPAAALARDGVPMPSSVAKGILALDAGLRADPGCREVFFADDRPLGVGETFRQPALARTLERLAERGPDEFYTGAVGERWLATLRQVGSLLSPRDLSEYRPEVGPALSVDVGDLRLLSSNPNTQGFALLRAVRESWTAASDASGAIDPVLLAEAFRRTNAVRDQFLADPMRGGLSGEQLLDVGVPDGVDAPYRGRPMGDTVGIAVASADGYAVSLIQSVYFQFGAVVLDPHTGVLFQNRGASFSLDPEAANAFAPGKRPGHTLMPVLIERGGELRWVSATMGGQGQPQIHAQLLEAVLTGSDPAAAVTRPRWLVGRQTPSDTPDTVTVENGVDAALVAEFDRTGLAVKRIPDLSDVVGHANLIELDGLGGMTAASDPRSDGSAVVC